MADGFEGERRPTIAFPNHFSWSVVRWSILGSEIFKQNWHREINQTKGKECWHLLIAAFVHRIRWANKCCGGKGKAALAPHFAASSCIVHTSPFLSCLFFINITVNTSCTFFLLNKRLYTFPYAHKTWLTVRDEGGVWDAEIIINERFGVIVVVSCLQHVLSG